jgi:outer membrane protein OmpA-like peptidoglycan-associated protein
MRLKKFIIAVTVLSSGIALSQGFKEKIADKKFDNEEYATASEMYAELAGKKTPKTKYFVRAGESHLKIGEYKKAEGFYSQAFSNQGMTDKDYYNYYQVLKYNGNYKRAAEVFAKINTSEFKNIRSSLTHHADYHEFLKDSSNFKIGKVEGINTDQSEFGAFPVGKDVYFASSRRNYGAVHKKFGWDDSYYLDLYVGNMDGSKVTHIHHVGDHMKTAYHEGPLVITKDGNTEYVTRNNVDHNHGVKGKDNHINLKIYYRGKLGEKWEEWKEFPYNSNDYSCGHPTLSDDGKTMYFVSDMPGTMGFTDIWVTRFENGNWTKPENLGQATNSEGKELFPFLFENEILLYSSDGKPGLGGMDLFYTVPSPDGGFEPQNLGYPVNTSFDELSAFATSNKSGYFSSNRPGGMGKDDIYTFESTNPIFSTPVNFIVKDLVSKAVLANAEVSILDDAGKVIGKANSDDQGHVKFNLIPGRNYKSKTKKDGYKNLDILVPEKDLAKLAKEPKDLFIEKKIFGLTGLVSDADNNNPIEGVKVTITDAFNKSNVKVYTTSNAGDFKEIWDKVKEGDDFSYIVKMEKKGYITKTVGADISIMKDGFVKLNEVTNMKMSKIKVGTDIGKLVDLKPIYFDVGKWDVKPEGAIELDKIVALMKENTGMVIELGSHTDCRGAAKANLTLSDKRAKSSAAYIITKGIGKDRIFGKGYGESKLINKCACEGKKIVNCSEEEHAQNRRTEFKIVKIKP